MRDMYEERRLRAYLQLDSFIPVSIYRSLLYSDSTADEHRQTPRDRGPWKLLSLLRHNRCRLCADPRDKVFSILGVSDLAKSNHPGLLIDYTKSVADVYVGAVQAIIQSSSTLEVLWSTKLTDATPNLNLPSWVPNWNAYKSPDAAHRPISYGIQKATGSSTADVVFWPDSGTRILSAVGFCFGTVTGFLEQFVKVNLDFPKDADLAARLTEYVRLYHQLLNSFTATAKILHPKLLSSDVFRRTCSLGLLDHKLDDSFQELMDDLELASTTDLLSQQPIKFLGMRFRYRTIVSR